MVTSSSAFGTTLNVRLLINLYMFVYAHIMCIKLCTYLPMRIKLCHICDGQIAPQKWGSQYKSDLGSLHTLELASNNYLCK